MGTVELRFRSCGLGRTSRRNLLARVPQSLREPVAAIVRTIFAQPDHASALGQLQKVADGLRKWLPAAAGVLEEAAEDILAQKHFPDEHRRRLHNTNPLERLNEEIERRSNVGGWERPIGRRRTRV